MKNKIFFLAILALAALGLQSCDKDTSAGLTRITYYPVITVLGGDVVSVNKGEAYTELGVYAELNGEDVSNQVEISSNVDPAEVGVYTVSYKVTNADGFSASASRTVVVGDAAITADISGDYAVSASSYREVLATDAQTTFGASYTISIEKVGSGVFYVSDFLAGWYDQRAGYGASYAMTGYILLKEDNTFELLSSHINGWGDSLDDLSNASYDPTDGKISWEATYAGAYTWFIDLEKQ
jgi:hypothetical protein